MSLFGMVMLLVFREINCLIINGGKFDLVDVIVLFVGMFVVWFSVIFVRVNNIILIR